MTALSKLLDSIDQELHKVHVKICAHCSRASNEAVDVDAMRSAEEPGLLVGLYLRGWTWQEIKEKLDEPSRRN